MLQSMGLQRVRCDWVTEQQILCGSKTGSRGERSALTPASDSTPSSATSSSVRYSSRTDLLCSEYCSATNPELLELQKHQCGTQLCVASLRSDSLTVYQRLAQRDRGQKLNSFWPMLPIPVLWTSLQIDWIEKSQIVSDSKLHNHDPFFHLIQKCHLC